MECSEISIQEARAFKSLRASSKWMTNKELAATSNIADRTARSFTKKWVDLGIADLAEVSPGHRYRYSGMADRRNKAYLSRLIAALEIFEMN